MDDSPVSTAEKDCQLEILHQRGNFIAQEDEMARLYFFDSKIDSEELDVEKIENSAFVIQNEGDLVAAESFTVIQGALESSNVDMNTELTKLIEAQRSFQLYSSAMKIIDQMDQNGTSKIASV